MFPLTHTHALLNVDKWALIDNVPFTWRQRAYQNTPDCSKTKSLLFYATNVTISLKNITKQYIN